MRRPLVWTTQLAIVFAALLLAPSAVTAKTTAKPKPVVSPGLETIVQDDGLLLYRPATEVQAAVARMKALGADRVRITASWSSLTRGAELDQKPEFDARDPAAYEQGRWAALDTAIRAIRSGGLKAVVDIGFWAPHWATSDPPGARARTNIDPNAYADFAAAVVRRYAGAFAPVAEPAGPMAPAPGQDENLIKSILKPLLPFLLPRSLRSVRAAQAGGTAAPAEPLPAVDEYILWNEPNHQGLLLPQWNGTTPASPGIYRAMVRSAYAAIKSVRNDAKVLIGNTSSTGGKRGIGPVAPLEFVRALACVDAQMRPRTTGDCAGFKVLPGDGWAHHPYSQNERPSRISRADKEPDDLRLGDLPQLARTLNRLVRMGRIARANRDIHLTEFGYETKGIRGRPRVDELKQARWLTWAEYLADRVPTVRSFAQFLLRDQPPSPTRVSASEGRPFGEYSTGLLLVDGKEKIAARTFLAGLFAQLERKGRVLLYGRLRLGAGRRAIVLQRKRPRGRWERVVRLGIDGRASFTYRLKHAPGAQYRLTYPDVTGKRTVGLALKPVPVAR